MKSARTLSSRQRAATICSPPVSSDRFAEHQRAARGVELVERVADGRVGAATGCRVRLAALGRHPQLVELAFDAVLLARPLQVFARGLRRPHDRVVVAVQLDAEADDRLAGGRDAVDDLLRPAVLDADDDHRRDVRVAAGADQRAEVQVEVGAELQPAVRMRDRERALDVVGDRLAAAFDRSSTGRIDDVVAHADAAVLAAVTPEGLCSMRYHRFVLMLWTWACSPFLIGCTTLPMSTPYLITVSPTAMSFSAILWPSGMSWQRGRVRSSGPRRGSRPVSVAPALTPSTTTTATESLRVVQHAVNHGSSGGDGIGGSRNGIGGCGKCAES